MKQNQKGFSHLLLLVMLLAVIAIVGYTGYRVFSGNKNNSTSNMPTGAHQVNPEDANSTDPVTKGRFLTGGNCSGSGSRTLTHTLMDINNIDDIQPMGLMIGGHVTPVDHEYYWGPGGSNSPVDAYPVYADADGTISQVQYANDGQKIAWWVTIAHSCTFISNYNLLTSLAPTLKAKVTTGTGDHWEAVVNMPVKSGQLIGYVGHQSLDFQVWDTTKTLKGFLNPIAYNNREPWKINTVAPLDYFTSAVKSQILPKYLRTVAPLDGRIDYDVYGEAVGNWFLEGTNGYAGGNEQGNSNYYGGHLSLTYNYLDPSAEEFSIGNYQGQPTQFAVTGDVDWTKITSSSGLVKVGLAQPNLVTTSGQIWSGQFSQNIKLEAGPNEATALLQMTGAETMKVEVFPGKVPAQINNFDSSVQTYNRGQDAHLTTSNTATH
ncbi:MAG TPA: hypothetical protein VGS08_04230 [Candidatus Saccharimonadales bacterium]|nr:hypothetical protein [Candidatus Saccharimonadales bacterium]